MAHSSFGLQIDVRRRTAVTLGRHGSAEAYRAALSAANVRLDNGADHMLRSQHFHISESERDVELALISAKDLGFRRTAPYTYFCLRGIAAGLKLCSPEVGPAWRLQYMDQPDHEKITLAMHELLSPHQIWYSTFSLWNPVPAIVGMEGDAYTPKNNEPGAPLWLCSYHFRIWYAELVFELPS